MGPRRTVHAERQRGKLQVSSAGEVQRLLASVVAQGSSTSHWLQIACPGGLGRLGESWRVRIRCELCWIPLPLGGFGTCVSWGALRDKHATTGHVPVEQCSPPATIPAGTPPQRGLPPLGDAPRQQRSRRGRRHNGACPRWAMLLANNDPSLDAATTGLAGLPPLGDAPRQQRSRRGRRHNGACPRWAMLLANNDPSGDAATTGLAPVGRCSPPATIPAGTPPQRGLPPLGVAPRQQRSRRGRRHNGACPRWAMLLAQQTALSGGEQRPAGTSPAVAGMGAAHGLARSIAPLGRAGRAQRWREWARRTGWRGAAPRLGSTTLDLAIDEFQADVSQLAGFLLMMRHMQHGHAGFSLDAAQQLNDGLPGSFIDGA